MVSTIWPLITTTQAKWSKLDCRKILRTFTP